MEEISVQAHERGEGPAPQPGNSHESHRGTWSTIVVALIVVVAGLVYWFYFRVPPPIDDTGSEPETSTTTDEAVATTTEDDLGSELFEASNPVGNIPEGGGDVANPLEGAYTNPFSE